jgi:hypothetical protein
MGKKLMDDTDVNKVLSAALSKVKGIELICRLQDPDHQPLLDKEREAEARSLMGLGKVINTGVIEVLSYDAVFAALTTMDFDWGCQATLVLKKGAEVVGEEVRDKAKIAKLENRQNVWFLHRNFVVYKDRVNFPQDIMKKICHFEIPFLPAKFCILQDDRLEPYCINYAIPSTLCDLYIKSEFFNNRDEQGLGTILVGVKL